MPPAFRTATSSLTSPHSILPSTRSVAPSSSVVRYKPLALFRLVLHRGRLMPALHLSVQQWRLLLQVLLQFCRGGLLPIVAYAFYRLHPAALIIALIFSPLYFFLLLISLQYTPRGIILAATISDAPLRPLHRIQCLCCARLDQ